MSKQTAIKLLSGILSVILIFHVLILIQIIPYEMVWAGKLQSLEEMYAFESVSLLVNVLLLLVLWVKWKNLKRNTRSKIITIVLWGFVILFALNTVGNLFASNLIELVLGVLLTALSSVLCWVIVR